MSTASLNIPGIASVSVAGDLATISIASTHRITITIEGQTATIRIIKL